MSHEFNNTDNMIDVRDVIERFEELETELEGYDGDNKVAAELGRAEYPSDVTTAQGGETINAYDTGRELASLESLLSDLAGNGGDEQWRGDWYPLTLIRDDYFETAMDELLEDCGDLPKDLPGYLSITVNYTALQMDYTSTEIDGVTYWYR